jgi:hypothetical protein
MISERRISDLEREVRRLQQELAQRPLKPPKGSSTAQVKRLVIDTGNTLATGQNGIKKTSTITDVPSAYDPTVTSSFIDGVGRGTLWINGVSQGLVLIINDGGGGSNINFDLLGGSDPDVGSPIAALATLTVGGDPNTTVTAYRIDSLVG